MSATGRGGARMRHDWYRTPAWTVLRLRDARPFPTHASARYIDPGAGDGAIIRAFNAWSERRRMPTPSWTAVELDTEHLSTLGSTGARVVVGDYLGALPDLDGLADMSLGNPPYKTAEGFVQQSRQRSRAVSLLLPLDFLGSAERCPLFARDMPDVLVLPQRPTFVVVHTFELDGTIKTTSSDAQTYAWFCWPERPQPVGQICHLGMTAPDVLAAARAAAPQVWIEAGEVVRVDLGDPFYIGR